MYSIKINYGINKGDVQIFTTKQELKKAFKNEKEFDKYIKKIKKESLKGVMNDGRQFNNNKRSL